MNEDAQAALLKTLEEPPAGVTLILCADAEEPLLPTIRRAAPASDSGRSAPARSRRSWPSMGWPTPRSRADCARITGGRPGLALALARQPEALRVRDELSRSLLDLLAARPAERLAGVRAAVVRAGSLTTMGDGAAEPAPVGGKATARPPRPPPPPPDAADADGDPGDEGGTNVRTPAAERRRAAEALIGLWTDTARDLALCRRGLERSIRDVGLLDETTAMAQRIDAGALDAFLDRLGRASVLIVANVSPELILDDLALAWPRPTAAAA